MTTVPPVNQRGSISAVLVTDMPDDPHTPPGAFEYYSDADGPEAGILFGCPCNCGSLFSISFRTHNGGPSWTWDRNRERPTCTPSILIYQMEEGTGRRIGEHWHGYLTAGEFRSC